MHPRSIQKESENKEPSQRRKTIIMQQKSPVQEPQNNNNQLTSVEQPSWLLLSRYQIAMTDCYTRLPPKNAHAHKHKCIITAWLKLSKSRISKKEFVCTKYRGLLLTDRSAFHCLQVTLQHKVTICPQNISTVVSVLRHCGVHKHSEAPFTQLPAVDARSWRWYWDTGWQDRCCNGWSFYSHSQAWSEAVAYKCFPLGKQD